MRQKLAAFCEKWRMPILEELSEDPGTYSIVALDFKSRCTFPDGRNVGTLLLLMYDMGHFEPLWASGCQAPIGTVCEKIRRGLFGSRKVDFVGGGGVCTYACTS